MSLLLSQINSTICDTSLHVTALEASFVEAAGASLVASTKLLGLSNLLGTSGLGVLRGLCSFSSAPSSLLVST